MNTKHIERHIMMAKKGKASFGNKNKDNRAKIMRSIEKNIECANKLLIKEGKETITYESIDNINIEGYDCVIEKAKTNKPKVEPVNLDLIENIRLERRAVDKIHEETDAYFDMLTENIDRVDETNICEIRDEFKRMNDRKNVHRDKEYLLFHGRVRRKGRMRYTFKTNESIDFLKDNGMEEVTKVRKFNLYSSTREYKNSSYLIDMNHIFCIADVEPKDYCVILRELIRIRVEVRSEVKVYDNIEAIRSQLLKK